MGKLLSSEVGALLQRMTPLKYEDADGSTMSFAGDGEILLASALTNKVVLIFPGGSEVDIADSFTAELWVQLINKYEKGEE